MSAQLEALRERLSELEQRRGELEEQLEVAAARLERKRAELARATADRLDTMVLRAEVAGLVEEVEALRGAVPLLDSDREAAASELERSELDALVEEHNAALTKAAEEVERFVAWMKEFLAREFAPRWIQVTAVVRESVDAERTLAARRDVPWAASALPDVLRHWWQTYRGTYAVAETLAREMGAFGVGLNDPEIHALAALRGMSEEERSQPAAAVRQAIEAAQPESQPA